MPIEKLGEEFSAGAHYYNYSSEKIYPDNDRRTFG